MRNVTDNLEPRESPGGPIVLLTDFGFADPFAGQMKGVILKIVPGARIVDLCHEVPPHNMVVAGMFLDGSWKFFPEGSIFITVVDPGVGTGRNAIIMHAHNRYFIGPDNGCMWPVIQKDVGDHENGGWSIYKIENREFMLPEISDTFHGRDIFAPVAAHLLKGLPIEDFGPKLESLVPLDIEFPSIDHDEVHGKIIHIDHFGNAWTNIHRAYLNEIGWLDKTEKIITRVASCKIRGIRRTYAVDNQYKPIALINSFGLVEIAWPGQSAKEKMRLWEGVWADLTLEQ
jgi:S-adenosylmethionine hydrolase